MTPDSPNCADSPRSWLGEDHERNERRTLWVVGLTLVMMVAEIVGGYWFGSMALVADGWHMGTHAAALGVAALAYRYARLHANNPRFTFGTGKVGDLAGFASAISLGIVAVMIAIESVQRLVSPQPIDYTQAIAIAALGLLVNLASAWLLRGEHSHAHGPGTEPAHGHDHAHDESHAHHHAAHHDHVHDDGHTSKIVQVKGGEDTNLRAAYVHVLADALTSVLAIVGLLAARWLGWIWADAAVGLLGAALIVQWSVGLARQAGRTLLDSHDDSGLEQAVRSRLLRAAPGASITDLHLWRVGPGQYAMIATLRGTALDVPATYRRTLADLTQLRHVTVEVNPD